MRKFRVKVNNQVFDVEVEEVVEQSNANPGLKTTNPVATAAPNARPAPGPVPQAERKSEANVVGSEGETITAPLPGNIVEVKVAPGQAVKAGDVLLVIEAMKMENEVVATVNGTVKEVLVQKGETVAVRQPLVVIS
ncbi:MAG: biotin/lipoyl-binding protein [Clostridia bacterium]|nr:biotin/lipoyl-binding protein [Clostridia bacterium]